jgi:hypothetical protein
VAIESGGIELGYLANAAFAVHQVFPKRFQINSDWGNNANTGDNDSSITHVFSIRR